MLVPPVSWSRRGVDALSFHARLARALGAILRTGQPAADGLRAAVEVVGGRRRRGLVIDIANLLERGRSLSEALAHDDVIDAHTVAVVRAAEGKAILPETLERLARHYELECELASAVRAGALYPALTLAVLLLQLAVVAFVVAPGFLSLVEGDGNPSPWLIWLASRGAQAVTAVVGATLMLVMIAKLGGRWPAFLRYAGSRLALATPFVGEMAASSVRTLVCRLLALQIEAGVRPDEALGIAASAFPAHPVGPELERKRQALTRGASLGSVTRPLDVLDRFVTTLLDNAWGTALLPTTLTRIADADERLVRAVVGDAKLLVEAVLLATLGVVAGAVICGQIGLYFESLGRLFPF